MVLLDLLPYRVNQLTYPFWSILKNSVFHSASEVEDHALDNVDKKTWDCDTETMTFPMWFSFWIIEQMFKCLIFNFQEETKFNLGFEYEIDNSHFTILFNLCQTFLIFPKLNKIEFKTIVLQANNSSLELFNIKRITIVICNCSFHS